MNSSNPKSMRESVVAVVVFDGVCALCSGWVRFLLRHDRRRRYRFAAMQTEAGRRLLVENGLDPDDPMSFLLVEYDRADDTGAPRVSTDSEAVRRVLMGLGGLWRLAAVSAVVPRALRDPFYRWVARNRYDWFGRRDACMMPEPAEVDRFL
jgi:predicted DCC family thiol-disulfide oxidoreductase YuxK